MQPGHRYLVGAVACLAMAGVYATALQAATTLSTLTSKDAAGGLRAALSQGIDTAVTQLGATDGFLKDPKVTIPLPPALQKAERAMRMIGMGKDAENLKVAMNHEGYAGVQARWGKGSKIPEKFTIPLERGTTIGGTVHNEEGQPVEGVKVEAVMCPSCRARQLLYCGSPETRAKRPRPGRPGPPASRTDHHFAGPAGSAARAH